MDEFDISIAGEKQKIHDAEREAEEKRIAARAAREMELAAKEKAINDFYHFFTLELLKGINKHLDSLNDGTFDHDNSITKIQGMNYRKEYFIVVRTDDETYNDRKKGMFLPETNSIDDLCWFREGLDIGKKTDERVANYIFKSENGTLDSWSRFQFFREFEERDKIIQEPLLENHINASFSNEKTRKRLQHKAGILDTCARIMSEMGISLSWEIRRGGYYGDPVIRDVTGRERTPAGKYVGNTIFEGQLQLFHMDMNYSKVIHVDYFHSYYAEIMNSIREKINRVHQKDIAKEAEMARKLQASIDAENKKKKKRKEQVNKAANRLLNSLQVSEKIKDAISKHQNDLFIRIFVRMEPYSRRKADCFDILADGWFTSGIPSKQIANGLFLLGLDSWNRVDANGNQKVNDEEIRKKWRRRRNGKLNAMEELLFSIKVEEVIEECIAILKSKKIFVTKSEKRSGTRTIYPKWDIDLELNW